MQLIVNLGTICFIPDNLIGLSLLVCGGGGVPPGQGDRGTEGHEGDGEFHPSKSHHICLINSR